MKIQLVFASYLVNNIMINIPTIPSLSKIHTQPVADITKTWKVGQVLNATAERNANAQGNALMRVGQTILQAKTPIALQAGDSLKLLVKSLGDTPLLKIQTAAATTIQQVTAQIAAQNLKSFIARQMDLTAVLSLSQKIITSPDISKILKQGLIDLNRNLPTVEQAIQAKTLKTLMQNSGVFLESRLKLLPSTIKPGLPPQNTQQSVALLHDVKAQLLRISAQLTSVVPELATKAPMALSKDIQAVIDPLIKQYIKGDISLIKLSTLLSIELPKNQSQLLQQILSRDTLTAADKTLLVGELKKSFTVLLNHLQQQANAKQVQDQLSSLLKNMDMLKELKIGIDGALAKITSQQLTTLTREADSLLLLLFGICLKDKTEEHLIQFRLQQEKPAKDKDVSSWTVELNFNFNELGSVQAKLRLVDNNISTVFRAQRESTVKSISNEINLLNTAFSRIGFEVINLNVTQGSVADTSDLVKGIHLLDEKA